MPKYGFSLTCILVDTILTREYTGHLKTLFWHILRSESCFLRNAGKQVAVFVINPFWSSVTFLWFSDVFRGYRNVTLN